MPIGGVSLAIRHLFDASVQLLSAVVGSLLACGDPPLLSPWASTSSVDASVSLAYAYGMALHRREQPGRPNVLFVKIIRPIRRYECLLVSGCVS